MSIHKLAITIRTIVALFCFFIVVLWIHTCTTELPSPTAVQDDSEPYTVVNGDTCEDDSTLGTLAFVIVEEPIVGFDYTTVQFNYGYAYHPDSLLIIEHVFTDTTIIWGQDD